DYTSFIVFFFFQAEDGIRDGHVTGVQTCALPISGKSTTIKILTTLLQKTSGFASVAGLNVDSDAAKIRKIIGVQNQDTVVDEDLTGRENLVLQGQLQQMHGPAIKERVDDLLNIVDLVDA